MKASIVERALSAIGVELIANWKDGLKMYSVWIFGLLAAMPELYELAVSMNLLEGGNLPEFINRAITIVAFLGVASRLIKQKSLEIGEKVEEKATE